MGIVKQIDERHHHPQTGDILTLYDGRRGVIESVIELESGERMYRIGGIPLPVRGIAIREVEPAVRPG